MAYLQNRNPGEVLLNHALSIKLLAKTRGIGLSISNPTQKATGPSVDYTYLTEFVLLIGRLINKVQKSGHLYVYPFGKDLGSENIWCTLESKDILDLDLSNLVFGLDLHVLKNSIGNVHHLDILYPKTDNEKKVSAIKNMPAELLSNINKPFYANLHASLKGNYNSSKDFLKTANESSMEGGQFLQRINDLIFANINNETFDTIKLCSALTISRSQLYRKMKLFVRRSPAAYIRYVRLTNAKQMLERTKKSIGDIAFDVGYTDQSHFTRSFKSQYGYHPSFYRQQCKGDADL